MQGSICLHIPASTSTNGMLSAHPASPTGRKNPCLSIIDMSQESISYVLIDVQAHERALVSVVELGMIAFQGESIVLYHFLRIL